MVVSSQSPVSEAPSVQPSKINMASKQTSVADTRAELADLVKRKAEVAVSDYYGTGVICFSLKPNQSV